MQIRMQQLAECIRHLQQKESQPSQAIFQQLESLSDATPVIQRHHIYSGEGDLWIGPIDPRNGTGKMYLSLLECIITLIQSTSYNVQIRIQAIGLVKRLLNNQSAVFSYYQENGKKHGDPTTCVAYPLAKALLTGIENDRNQEVSGKASQNGGRENVLLSSSSIRQWLICKRNRCLVKMYWIVYWSRYKKKIVFDYYGHFWKIEIKTTRPCTYCLSRLVSLHPTSRNMY